MSDSTTLEKTVETAANTAVAVQSLALSQFRSYAHVRLEPEGRSVVLTGENGAGKTNILEAVSLLAPGRGLRRAKLSEIDRLGGAGPWAVAATVATPRGEVQIGTGRDAASNAESDKRLVKIDGKPARSHTALAPYVAIVWLTPESDRVFLEGPYARRKFLDRLVYGFDPDHAARVASYDYAMRERNRLLYERRGDAQWLSTLERKMAETSVAIAAARLDTVAHLNAVMRGSQLSFPKAELALAGFVESRLMNAETALAIEEALAATLAASRVDDAQSGRSSQGAHRSELSVTHLAKNMEAALCSTGEQKALLLAIALAEARAGAIWHGRSPILLFDEVAAHLDAQKRAELFEEIHDVGAQAWMTGTDVELFQGMRDMAPIFRVENGVVNSSF